MMQMTCEPLLRDNNTDILFWFDIMEYQCVEDDIIADLRFDKDGKKRALPPFYDIAEKVEKKIAENKKKYQNDLSSYLRILERRQSMELEDNGE